MYRRRLSFLSLLLILSLANALTAQTARRPLKLDDMTRFRNVSDPQVSPDGKWVAYVVNTTDAKDDKSNSHIWMIGIDGEQRSPNHFQSGKRKFAALVAGWQVSFVYFFSSRQSARQPGLAARSKWRRSDASSPRSKAGCKVTSGHRMESVWRSSSEIRIRRPKPDHRLNQARHRAFQNPSSSIVTGIKQDGQGYLLTGRHTFIYIFDIETKKLDRLTKSKWDESSPAWSPDGTRIAFMSNHSDDPDRDPSAQLYVAEAKPGSTEKQLTPERSSRWTLAA